MHWELLVAASERLRDSWDGDPSVLDRELDRAKRDVVESIKDPAFDDIEII